MHWEEIWSAPTFEARAIRTLLTPASWLYAAGWQAYLAMYSMGIKQARGPHSPVVCIGNLQVGGTGKTPATVHLADLLQKLGRSLVISCSGYGSPASEAAQFAPDGPLLAREWGDEAALFRLLRPNIPLIVGRRRVLAAELCPEEAVLLMDDGFQHLPLKKHLSLVLDPPLTNHRCLPAGPYREPFANRRRADLVLPGKFSIRQGPTAFQTPEGKPQALSGEVSVLCALGRPQSFLHSLREANLSIGTAELRPDHDSLTDGNLLSNLPAGKTIVVTGKDWVKLRDRNDVEKYDIAIASYDVSIEPRHEFKDWLQAKLNGIPTKRS